MPQKRVRGSLDVLGGTNDIFGESEVHSPTDNDTVDNVDSSLHLHKNSLIPNRLENSLFQSSSSPHKRPRVLYSTADAFPSPTAPSADTSSSTATATLDSLCGDEIELLGRKDEEIADMALFLVKAVGEAPSSFSLRELVVFLETTGLPRVFLALKRTEGTEAFVSSLFVAHPIAAQRSLLLQLLLEFFQFVDADVFFQKNVLAFLVESLPLLETNAQQHVATTTKAAATSTSLFSPTTAAVHWSARKKRVSPSAAAVRVASPQPPPQAPEDPNDDLSERVRLLCAFSHASVYPSFRSSVSTTNNAINNAVLSLRALLTLAFESNRRFLLSSASSGISVPLLFAYAGGMERVGELFNTESTRDAALPLLEVLTSSDVLCREGARLRQLVPSLVRLLRASNTPLAVQVSVLKVMTNITNLLPTALSDTNTVTLFVAFMQEVLVQPAADVTGSGGDDTVERESFTLCCAINIVKYEAKEKSVSVVPTFTRAFVACTDFLSALARSMTTRYHSNDAQQLVLSGYAALLLGALSLVDLGEAEPTSLRVPVMTAVATASQGTLIGKSADRQPMRIVAAIIQEFLLFQSASGTLTKEALVEMDSLVNRIREHNHITVAAVAEKDAVEDSTGNESDDEVTLGELL